MEERVLMSVLDILLGRLEESGVPRKDGPKEEKPTEIAFVDVLRCTACNSCVESCPAHCIEALPEGAVEGNTGAPVQVRYAECTGCHLCVEICAHLCEVGAIRTYDVNLVEQILSTEINATGEPAGQPPEAWDDLFAEGGGFHHMGEGSQINALLSPEDEITLSEFRATRGGKA